MCATTRRREEENNKQHRLVSIARQDGDKTETTVDNNNLRLFILLLRRNEFGLDDKYNGLRLNINKRIDIWRESLFFFRNAYSLPVMPRDVRIGVKSNEANFEKNVQSRLPRRGWEEGSRIEASAPRVVSTRPYHVKSLIASGQSVCTNWK